MYSLIFYVPESHLESVKGAVFKAGAGSSNQYDRCCWQIAGQHQFRPLTGSEPFIGSTDELETVSEYRVEMICQDKYIKTALAALNEAHPYEKPAYSYSSINPVLL